MAMSQFPFAARRRILTVLAPVVAIASLGIAPSPVQPAEPADALPAGAIARFGTTRFRTGDSVQALVFSPDGNRLASWGSGDQFALWEADTGKLIRSVRTKSGSLLAMNWSKEGPGLAVLKSGQTFGAGGMIVPDLNLWDFSTDMPAPLPAGDFGGGIAIAPAVPGGPAVPSYDAAVVSADGKMLIAATSINGKPDAVLAFELRAVKSIKELKRLSVFDVPASKCSALAMSPDGKRLSGICRTDKDGKPNAGRALVIWDATGKIAHTIDVPEAASQGSRFALSLSNESAVVGLETGDSLVVDLDSGTTRTLKTGHLGRKKSQGNGVFAAAFAPDSATFATAGRDGMIRITDLATGKLTREFGPHSSWPEAVAFTADGKRLASAGQDGVIRVWDATNGKEAVPTGGHGHSVWRVSASADGKTVLTEGGGEIIRVWDAATGAERRQIAAGGRVAFCKQTPDGRQVIATVGSDDGSGNALQVWDTATGKDATPAGFPKTLAVSGFRITPDGKTLVTFQEDKLSAFAWPAGNNLWTADMPKPAKPQGINQIGSVAISPDGRHFVTTAMRSWYREEKGLKFGYSADPIVDLWDTATGKVIRRLVEQGGHRPGTYAADSMYIHNGGGMLPNDLHNGAAVRTRAQLCVIDPLTGRLVREFANSGRPDGFDSGFAIALSGDGKVLFRATQVGEVQLFEVATGSFRTAFPGHRASIFALDAPTLDVRRVVSGSADTTALLWDVGFGGKTGAALTADERPKLWEALSDANGKNAYEAMVKLAGDPAGFVALASAELKPAPAGPKAADLAPIFRDLDSKVFATREAAAAALDKHGEAAIALIRARLEVETSAEVRERLIRFLEKCDGPAAIPERLRHGRAVELLEHLATTDAKALLEKLAKGGASRLTTEAAGAMKRLEER